MKQKLTFFDTITCPPSKVDAHHGQYTLLDNKAVLHAVQRYLAAQKLGAITPHLLCCHVNDVILLALEMIEKNGSISECTAINWLKNWVMSVKT